MIRSAGILLHRGAAPDVLIAHMGGPFWARKDAGAWSIPKGEYDPEAEAPWDAAVREFREELGVDPPDAAPVDLGEFRMPSGKRLTVFALDGSPFAPTAYVFGEFELEWPPKSGRLQSFPEVDRVEWMPLAAARAALVRGQLPALDALARHLAGPRA